MNCEEILSSYFDTFKSNVSCAPVPHGRLSVVLPFCYPDHDNIEIFIKDVGEDSVVVSDLGETLRKLDTIGMDYQASGRLAYQADKIAAGFNARIKNGILLKEGSREEVGVIMLDLLSACMAIGDLAYSGRGFQPITFVDEVAKLLTVNDYKFDRRYPVRGKSTSIYNIDLKVTTQRRVSYIQTQTPRTKGGVRGWVNQTYRMWNDIKTGRGQVVRKVSLLDDITIKTRPEDVKILESVSNVYRWSERQTFLAALQDDQATPTKA